MIQQSLAAWLLGLPRSRKRALAVSVDVVLCLWTAWAAVYLRLGEWVSVSGNLWLAVVVAPLLAIPVFISSGLYRAIFRYAGWLALLAVARACLVYGVGYALMFTFVGIEGVPRTVGLIQPALLFMMIAASRALAHYLLGGSYRRILSKESSPHVLIYGAGASGRQLASALAVSSQMKVVGFLDDDRSLQGATLNRLPIMDPRKITEIAQLHQVTDVLLAMPSVSRSRRRQILDLLRPAMVNVRTLPGLLDLAHGRIQVSDVRPLEIEDLLGRDPVVSDRMLAKAGIAGKNVLVTGGGGSIGSELCRQILALGPAKLLVLDSSEYALYAIHRDLRARCGQENHQTTIVPLLASVTDEARMAAIMSSFRPESVYHAAAYKHVPLVEHNPLEALKNNVFGTLITARLAAEHGAANFVLVSTDKAVRPTNVMGASKRLAEMVLQAFAGTNDRCRFSMVRFGNVLGSSGSVVPLFRQQILDGGPITITHPDITRYFMTIPEAVQLVVQSAAMSNGGEVFVLDMGEPVRILDLAVNMIELAGLSVRNENNPDGDVEIAVIGLRPGEKLYEELLIGENPQATTHPRILQAREDYLPMADLQPRLAELRGVVDANDVTAAIACLNSLVPEYQPEGRLVDWLVLNGKGQQAAAADAEAGHGTVRHVLPPAQPAEPASVRRLIGGEFGRRPAVAIRGED